MSMTQPVDHLAAAVASRQEARHRLNPARSCRNTGELNVVVLSNLRELIIIVSDRSPRCPAERTVSASGDAGLYAGRRAIQARAEGTGGTSEKGELPVSLRLREGRRTQSDSRNAERSGSICDVTLEALQVLNDPSITPCFPLPSLTALAAALLALRLVAAASACLFSVARSLFGL